MRKFILAIVLINSTVIITSGQEVVVPIDPIFPIGERVSSENFVGEPWVMRLFAAEGSFNSSIGNVTFNPGTRSNWHYHPAGQILLALDGIGYYQEEGKELRILRPGDTVKCPPNVKHWHGASHDDWFVQLAITASHQEGRVIWLHPVSQAEYDAGLQTEVKALALSSLSNRHKHFAIISSFTAQGDLEKLKPALDRALDEGMSINEIKEVLVHLYAYCGFPRSIQGLITLLSLVDERKAQGITDVIGATASEIDQSKDKYNRGAKVLEELTGIPYAPATSGYRAFSPEMDVFLKEHLFADIFERDVLSYQDREICTISALINLGGVEPMMRGHMGIALNIGITPEQLDELITVIEFNTSKKGIGVARDILMGIQTSR